MEPANKTSYTTAQASYRSAVVALLRCKGIVNDLTDAEEAFIVDAFKVSIRCDSVATVIVMDRYTGL